MHSEYQLTLPAQGLDSADTEARAVLQKAQAQVGFIPNMYKGMANSPGLLDTYLSGYAKFRSDSTFTPVEQEVVFLTISRSNRCGYCMAAHSFLADKKSQVPPAITDAIRDGTAIPDARIAALSAFTAEMFTTRGLPSAQAVQAFLKAGYTERQILEIVLALAVKTLSNYANHLFHTPVDDMFSARAWKA